MPKATISPLVRAVKFFEEADLTSAENALDLAKEVIRRRVAAERPAGAQKIPKPRARRSAGPGPVESSQV